MVFQMARSFPSMAESWICIPKVGIFVFQGGGLQRGPPQPWFTPKTVLWSSTQNLATASFRFFPGFLRIMRGSGWTKHPRVVEPTFFWMLQVITSLSITRWWFQTLVFRVHQLLYLRDMIPFSTRSTSEPPPPPQRKNCSSTVLNVFFLDFLLDFLCPYSSPNPPNTLWGSVFDPPKGRCHTWVQTPILTFGVSFLRPWCCCSWFVVGYLNFEILYPAVKGGEMGEERKEGGWVVGCCGSGCGWCFERQKRNIYIYDYMSIFWMTSIWIFSRWCFSLCLIPPQKTK